MKCLATFSLWGDNPVYTVGAIKQLELYNNWSKEGPYTWECIFYVGDSVPGRFVDCILDRGGLVVRMEGWPEDQTSTFWRWTAFHTSYGFYDAVFSRDTDSRLSDREKLAVTEFLYSKYDFHVVRDHPFHGVPILAGLFGGKSSIFGLLSDLLPPKVPEDFWVNVKRRIKHPDLNNVYSNDFYQVDQHWLRFNVFPKIGYRQLAHDAYFGFNRKRFRSYLPDREPGDFIGKGFDENDRPRHPEHDLLLEKWPRKYR